MFFRTNEPHGLPRHPFKSCIVPRPIGWVSTVADDGVHNLAPFSFYNGIASDPPMVMISINGRQPHGNEKDTLSNIRTSKEFTVNITTEALKDPMNASCAPLPPEADEFEVAGLTKAPGTAISTPRVAESPIALECTLHQIIDLPCDIPDDRNAMVLGQVVGIYINDDVLTEGMIDITKLRPLARMGYMDYATITEVFTLNRPAGSPNPGGV